MLIKTYGGAVYGVNAAIITIEVNIIQGASFYMVGLPDSAVKESQFRIESTLKNNGFEMPQRKIIINMAPADLKKEGSAYDLPLGIGILAATGQREFKDLEKYLLMGELSLDGVIRPIRGALPIAIEAWKNGFKLLEIPIIFVDRIFGHSKMSKHIVYEAVFMVWKLRLKSIFGKLN